MGSGRPARFAELGQEGTEDEVGLFEDRARRVQSHAGVEVA